MLSKKLRTTETHGTDKDAIRRSVIRLVEQDGFEGDPFFLLDLGDIHRKHENFLRLLPRVSPFYAVKCNPDPTILQAMVSMGLSFDCASRAEIAAVMDLGVSPQNIIYANPCKPIPHLKYARSVGVTKMTFDNEEELFKVKQHHPEAELVLRILADDSKSVCRLGLKFGAAPDQAIHLLRSARQLDLNVVGVSFHVGSGCTDASTFGDAVARARRVFDDAAALGFNLTLLDVGGGFPGHNENSVVPPGSITFEDIAAELNDALNRLFPEESGVRIIAEPGRYYVASAAHLAVNVLSKRRVNRDAAEVQEEGGLIVAGGSPTGNDNPAFMYYVNDGVYGAFNCILFDHAEVMGEPLLAPRQPDMLFETSLWGPTCDSMDCIRRNVEMPELDVGDWLLFRDMGAYTMAASSTFNGFPKAHVVYTFSYTDVESTTNIPEDYPLHPVALSVSS